MVDNLLVRIPPPHLGGGGGEDGRNCPKLKLSFVIHGVTVVTLRMFTILNLMKLNLFTCDNLIPKWPDCPTTPKPLSSTPQKQV